MAFRFFAIFVVISTLLFYVNMLRLYQYLDPPQPFIMTSELTAQELLYRAWLFVSPYKLFAICLKLRFLDQIMLFRLWTLSLFAAYIMLRIVVAFAAQLASPTFWDLVERLGYWVPFVDIFIPYLCERYIRRSAFARP
jgi:hypothetical protein